MVSLFHALQNFESREQETIYGKYKALGVFSTKKATKQ